MAERWTCTYCGSEFARSAALGQERDAHAATAAYLESAQDAGKQLGRAVLVGWELSQEHGECWLCGGSGYGSVDDPSERPLVFLHEENCPMEQEAVKKLVARNTPAQTTQENRICGACKHPKPEEADRCWWAFCATARKNVRKHNTCGKWEAEPTTQNSKQGEK